jgi:hypothetical protein
MRHSPLEERTRRTRSGRRSAGRRARNRVAAANPPEGDQHGPKCRGATLPRPTNRRRTSRTPAAPRGRGPGSPASPGCATEGLPCRPCRGARSRILVGRRRHRRRHRRRAARRRSRRDDWCRPTRRSAHAIEAAGVVVSADGRAGARGRHGGRAPARRRAFDLVILATQPPQVVEDAATTAPHADRRRRHGACCRTACARSGSPASSAPTTCSARSSPGARPMDRARLLRRPHEAASPDRSIPRRRVGPAFDQLAELLGARRPDQDHRQPARRALEQAGPQRRDLVARHDRRRATRAAGGRGARYRRLALEIMTEVVRRRPPRVASGSKASPARSISSGSR